MVSFEKALSDILAAFSPLETEPVGILDALGRAAGKDIHADRPLPPQDHSTRDGYALRARDVRSASPDNPLRLAVLETIPAGTLPRQRLGRGQAARIMTGALIPAGADAVIPLEQSRREGDRVVIPAAVGKGRHIRQAGEEVRQGEKVIARGALIGPTEVGLLASLGRPSLPLHRRPRVAVIPTGDELLEIGAPPVPGKIVGSNGYLIAALLKSCGAIPLLLGIAGDDREDLRRHFRAAGQADLILSSGGVSGGDFDLVKEILKSEGNRLHFQQVAMKPGRSLAFGSQGNIPVIALPGSPGAVAVCFEQFVRPALRRMQGHRELFHKTVTARLSEDIDKEEGIRCFLWGEFHPDGTGQPTVSAVKNRARYRETTGRTGCLIVLPEEDALVPEGATVQVQLLEDIPGTMPLPAV